MSKSYCIKTYTIAKGITKEIRVDIDGYYNALMGGEGRLVTYHIT